MNTATNVTEKIHTQTLTVPCLVCISLAIICTSMSDESDEDDIFLRDDDKNYVDSVRVRPLWENFPVKEGPRERDPQSCTRLVLMSDSHGEHRNAAMPSGDVLIHAGDMTLRGEPGTLQDMAQFFQELQQSGAFHQIILVAGNHDLTLQPSFFENQAYTRKRPPLYEDSVKALKESCVYLEDDSCILFPTSSSTSTHTLSVYGSPWSIQYGSWAFMKQEKDMPSICEAIPIETDILITHGPPYKRGDEVHTDIHVGSPSLLKQVQTRIKPRLHIFGHIHEDSGWVGYDGTTMFVNASIVDLRYRPIEPCVVIDVPHDRSQPVVLVPPKSPVSSTEEFLTWLNERSHDDCGYAGLSQHLLRVGNDALDDSIDWDYPWAVLSSLPIVFSRLLMHRDVNLEREFAKAFRELYAESFCLDASS